MFTHRVQMRFSDCDALGHVNNARYLSYYEDARIAYLTSLAGGDADLRVTGVILARMEVDYLTALELSNEPLEVDVWISKVGTKSVTMRAEVRQHGVTASRSVAVLVAYDYARNASRPLSDAERRVLEAAVPATEA